MPQASLFAEIEEEFLDLYALWLTRERRQPQIEVVMHPDTLPALVRSIPRKRRREFRFNASPEAAAPVVFYDLTFRRASDHPRRCVSIRVNGAIASVIVINET